MGHDADALEMKLAMRSLPCATGEPQGRASLQRSIGSPVAGTWHVQLLQYVFEYSRAGPNPKPRVFWHCHPAADTVPQQRPTLAFSWRGHNVTMVQELPVRWVGVLLPLSYDFKYTIQPAGSGQLTRSC